MQLSSWRNWLNKPTPTFADRLAWWSLRLLCLPYLSIIVFRNRLYDWRIKSCFRAEARVISVGNLSVGGTGKSPTVAWLARWLRTQQARVAILSRGYGQLDNGRNDEALELELKLPDVPHLQNADRVASAKLAVEELEMEYLILDDGFQHRRLARDLDVVLIDATDSSAAQWPLPAGLRREPLSSLRRAHFVILTRVDAVTPTRLTEMRKQLQVYMPSDCIALAVHQPESLLQIPQSSGWPVDGQLLHHSLDRLKGAQVLAFCGIGNPHAFFHSLIQLGATLVNRRAWPDHHAYTADDISWLGRWHSENRDAVLVCTVKDWVKIQESQLGGRDLYAVEIQLQIVDGAENLEKKLLQLL